MSGQRLSRKQRFAGKIGAAAVIATLSGLPQDLVHLAVGDQDGANLAFAAAKPNPPPPPPPKPPSRPIQPLNADPNTHWFAAWDENTPPSSPDFFPTPPNTLGVPAVQAALNGTPSNTPRGLKVLSPLTDPEAISLFYPTYTGSRPISWVFSDMETGSASVQVNNVRRLVEQVRDGGASRNAYVGHFDLTPVSSIGTGPKEDPTRRGPLTFTKVAYDAARVNMANSVLYPGQDSFRNTSTNDWNNANIRTGLFIGPIGRMTAVQNVLNDDYKGDRTSVDDRNHHKQVPWVARFNNYGNNSLDTDGNSANGYRFVPGAPLASNPTLNTSQQMMGRGDFSAQILHYRMRGAYSVNLFHEGGASGQVEGYSSADAKQDIRNGWYGASDANVAHANTIFGTSSNAIATMTLNPVVDGSKSASGLRSEETGTLWSGVYSAKSKQLDILLSNLDTNAHMVNFGEVNGKDVFTLKNSAGYTYDTGPDDDVPNDDGTNNSGAITRLAQIEAGIHKILQFEEKRTRIYRSLADFTAQNSNYETRSIWLLNQQYEVFGGNNRNDVGIPEPTTFGMLAAAGSMAVVCRRQRRLAKAKADA